MSISFRSLILFLFAIGFLFTAVLNAQQLRIRVEKPFFSEKLSGIVTDPNGEPLPGVEVARLDSSWKKIVDTNSTDENGKFAFPEPSEGVYYLRFTIFGFNELEVKIRLNKKSKNELIFKLDVST